jgi:hypothetical protein
MTDLAPFRCELYVRAGLKAGATSAGLKAGATSAGLETGATVAG